MTVDGTAPEGLPAAEFAPDPTVAQPLGAAATGPAVEAMSPGYRPASPPANGAAQGRTLPLEALHDVELQVEVVLGRARLPLRDLLAARPRTTIELDRPVRSAVDVMINGTLFARGEMVVVDDSQIGVQITEIVGAELAAASQT